MQSYVGNVIKEIKLTMETKDTSIIIPVKIHESVRFGSDKFVVVDSIEPGFYFHKIYITIKDGKVYSYKTITIMNEHIFELGGTIFIKGHSLEADLVNGSEIL